MPNGAVHPPEFGIKSDMGMSPKSHTVEHYIIVGGSIDANVIIRCHRATRGAAHP